MGLFDDLGRFFETRLEEFLRKNPHLELQALSEQLREQEEDSLKLIRDFQLKEKEMQNQILSTAKEVQRWHDRIAKAKAAGREDLARAAQEREGALLRQGNQLWGKMQGAKERIERTKELYRKIHARRQEVDAKAAQVAAERATNKTQQNWDTAGWNKKYSKSASDSSDTIGDSLEQEFARWETEEELERMKRNMGS